jgi:hypothetical protein
MSMRDKTAGIARSLRYSSDNAEELADAIIAALPDMIEPLVWTEPDDNDYGHIFSGPYEITSKNSKLFIHGSLYGGMTLAFEFSASLAEAIITANAHHRAAIMAEFNPPTSEGE